MMQPNHLYYLTRYPLPALEICRPGGSAMRLRLQAAGDGRRPGEKLWMAELPDLGGGETWEFRIDQGNGRYDAPPGASYYRTALRTLWLQDGGIYGYRPAARVSPSRVEKIPAFTGRLPERALYIYLPRGYDEHQDRRYPVLYMHDGQNVFEAFAADSYAGSWGADLHADRLIGLGRMRECIIAGVSHGGRRRMAEYLPPYASVKPWITPPGGRDWTTPVRGKRLLLPYEAPVFTGLADRTFAYYRDDVAPYIHSNFRALAGREHAATCGSSMGGVFSLYIAWDHPGFARHHAVMSPAFAVTEDARGRMAPIERLRTGPLPDVRLWLDSGTRTSRERGDDGSRETAAARDILLERGFEQGPDFRYYLDRGATHSETAWAARLPQVLEFLFPPGAEPTGPDRGTRHAATL